MSRAAGRGQDRMVISDLYTVRGVHSGDRCYVPIDLPQAERAHLLVRQAGLVEMIDTWLAEDGYKPKAGGRPPAYTIEQVLTLFVLLALESQKLHVTLLRDAVMTRLTDNARDYLGIEPPSTKWLHKPAAVYQRLWRATRHVLKAIDPHPDEQRHSRYPIKEWYRVKDARDHDLEARRFARLREFNNALIWATIEGLPPDLMSRWDGTIAVDGTHIPTVKKGITSRSQRASSEPNAGWYTRTHEEIERDGKPHIKVVWAWDAALAVMANPGPGGYFPRLILGMSMDKPGAAPAQNAMTALNNVLEADLPRGYMVGDRAYYPGAKPETWQTLIRKAGYKIVGDLMIQKTPQGIKYGVGVQDSFGGALLVDGTWMCPAIPKGLAEATMDFSDGTITEDEKKTRQKRQQAYHLRAKEAPRDNGSQCFKCPASGPGATVDCPLKAMAPKAKGQPRRPKIREEDLPKHPGPICTNANSMTIPAEAGAKYKQSLPWESEEWKLAYHYPRNTIEGKNGYIKDDAGGSVASHGRRLLRGVAGQFFLTGIMIAAENVRATEALLRKKDSNEAYSPDPTPPPPTNLQTRREQLTHPTDLPNAPPLAA